MSLLSEEIDRALGEISRVMSSFGSGDTGTVAQQFTWNSQLIDAVAIVESEGELFGGGGLTLDNHLTITVMMSKFIGDRPKPKQFVTFREHLYKIQTVESSPDGRGLTLKCNDAARGAGIVEREM